MARMFARTVAIDVTSSQILGPNPRRTGLILSNPSANRYSVAFGEDAVLDGGVTMMPNSAPAQLNAETCGYDLTSSIHAIASVLTSVGITEVCNP